MAEQSANPWDDILTMLKGFDKTPTNREIYKNGPEAMRAWMASGAHMSFPQWLDSKPSTLQTGGR